MLFAALGKLDLLTVLVLMGAAILPHKLLFYAAIYLLLKGIFFGILLRDFASKIDLACGVYLMFLSQGITMPIIHTLVLLWLLQKTILTFIAIGVKLMLIYYRNRESIPFKF